MNVASTGPAGSPPDPAQRSALRRALLAHYDANRRSLPWRGESDPYRILVSEVMLQQTRVETVKRYYGPWLERFPDFETLARASEDQVLKAWEGLGYYRRARNLHRAARAVLASEGSSLPRGFRDLSALPGVGAYTAGAVASIAFGEREPAVDGNVRRVLTRLFDLSDPRPSLLRDTAAALVDPRRPGDFNQALMDLGATTCTPRGPSCGACPVAAWCASRARGTVSERTGSPVRKRPRPARFLVGVFHAGARVLLVRRPPDGLLGGLWAFPEVELGSGGGAGVAAPDPPPALRALALGMGLAAPTEARPLPPCAHRFTHVDATYLPWAGATARTQDADDRVWVTASEAEGLALPVAQRKILAEWLDEEARRRGGAAG